MKNLYILIIILCFATIKVDAQSDVIFWLDNSGSISNQEWTDMTSSIGSIIHEVLDCNPENRVAIVHYGYINGGRIFIEDPNNDGAFTNNEAEALNYLRRQGLVGGSDRAHETLGLIGNALDGIPSPFIMSTQTQLNHVATQNLVIYFFNDAVRDAFGSSLVDNANTTFNSNNAFLNYTNFKTNRNATFVVTSVAPNQNAIDANAIISSFSNTGNYSGTVENYPAEPNNSQVPRMYLDLTDFIISSGDLGIITSDLCFVNEPCPLDLALVQTVDNVASDTQENRQVQNTIDASNMIFNNAGAIYHAGSFVELNPGFEAVTGSRFAAYIEGCSDTYLYRNQMNDKKGDNDDIKGLEEFNIFPNPSRNITKIEHSNSKFNKIQIVSVIGEVALYREIKATNSFEIDINDFPEGIYIVRISLVNGKTLTKKLIKN